MKTKVLMSFAGLAACGAADAQVRPELQTAEFSGQYHQAIRATAITALTVDGQYVYGKTIELDGNANRGGLVNGAITAYDSAMMADTDGDGLFLDPVCGDLAGVTETAFQPSSRWWFGGDFSIQSFVEDIVPAAGTEGGTISEVVVAGSNFLCDGGTGGSSEVMQLVYESWEVVDNFPDGGGTDGYDTDADGLGDMMQMSDTDGDGFVDEFNGGLILTYADTDTTGDGAFDQLLSSGSAGYGIFFATGLDTLGIPLPSGQDVHNGSDLTGGSGTDGITDGGMRITWTSGDHGDMAGPLLGGFYPTTRATFMLWGPLVDQDAAYTCALPHAGFGAGDTDGMVSAEGENLCGDTNDGWSTGGLDGVVNNVYDTSADVSDFVDVISAPDTIGPMFRVGVSGAPVGVDCCDVNGDGACDPADFSAWLAAFNASAPNCDTNHDGACDPGDFSAWLAAFNSSMAGTPDTACTW